MAAEQKKWPMLRSLRIAFSVTCGIACVLLIVWSVRSYRVGDVLMGGIGGTRGIGVVSHQGQLTFSHFDYQALLVSELPWSFNSHPPASFTPVGSAWRLGNQTTPYPASFVVVPHLFPLVVVGFVAAITGFQRPYRFGLRTLLIAMTLVAVGLGLIFAVSR